MITDKNKLRYCGHVGTGFDEDTLTLIANLLKKYKTSVMPFAEKPPRIKQVTWVEPKLVVEVEFFEWTKEGILRHPSFQGIRMDKPAQKVIREQPSSIKKTTSKFKLTNPERVLYPQQGITKLELAQFYDEISEWILPYVIKRPLTLVRCPSGEHKKCFYQKHLDETDIEALYPINIKEKNKTEKYLYIKNQQGLISLVQLGVLEIHTWNCHIKNIEKPDMLVFDLDPAPDVAWKKVIKSAHFLREQLELIELTSFVKTSGGKGLHIVVPIKANYTWDEIKLFTQTFVKYMVHLKPNDYIGTMTQAKRKGKIFIDYFRNQRGATTVAPYSTRIKENAPVSTPLSWDELTPRIKSNSFTIKNLPQRLTRLKKDPWENFFKLRQKLKI